MGDHGTRVADVESTVSTVESWCASRHLHLSGNAETLEGKLRKIEKSVKTLIGTTVVAEKVDDVAPPSKTKKNKSIESMEDLELLSEEPPSAVKQKKKQLLESPEDPL